jgi:hypothetical protein
MNVFLVRDPMRTTGACDGFPVVVTAVADEALLRKYIVADPIYCR